MIQCRNRARFAQEPGAIFFSSGGKKLQRHAPAQSHVFGKIDHAHAAFAELLNDSIL
jgi:hypothetical protein